LGGVHGSRFYVIFRRSKHAGINATTHRVRVTQVHAQRARVSEVTVLIALNLVWLLTLYKNSLSGTCPLTESRSHIGAKEGARCFKSIVINLKVLAFLSNGITARTNDTPILLCFTM
jgi:hypothetical protein